MRRLPAVLAKSGAVTTLLRAHAVTAAINFITGMLLARALGPEARGVYSVLILWSNVTATVLLMGTHLRLARETSNSLEEHSGAARLSYSKGFTALVLLMAPTVLFYGAVIFLNEKVLGQNLPAVIWLIGILAVPFGAWAIVQAQVELVRKNFGIFSTIQVTFAGTQCLLVTFLWGISVDRVLVFAWVFLLSSVATATVAQILVWRSIMRVENAATESVFKYQPASMRRVRGAVTLITEAWRDGLAVILTTISASIDRILVVLLFPLEIVGLYFVAQSLAQLQSITIEALSPIFFSRLAGKSVDEIDVEPITQGLRKMVFLTLVLTGISLTVLPWMIPLVYGSAFAESAKFIVFLVPALAVRGLMRPFEEVLKAVNRALDHSYIAAFWSVMVVIAGALAGAQDRILHIPLAMFGVGLIAVLLSAVIVARILKIPLSFVLLPGVGDAKSLFADIVSRLHWSKVSD